MKPKTKEWKDRVINDFLMSFIYLVLNFEKQSF